MSTPPSGRLADLDRPSRHWRRPRSRDAALAAARRALGRAARRSGSRRDRRHSGSLTATVVAIRRRDRWGRGRRSHESAGEWGFAIESRLGADRGAPAACSTMRALARARGVGRAAARLGRRVAGPRGRARDRRGSVAVWRACRVAGRRAATVGDVDAVARAIRSLGVNLLVVEPAGKSISLLKQMSRDLRRAVPRDCRDGSSGRIGR